MLAAGVASQRQMGQSSEGGLSLGLGAFGVGTSPPVSFSVPQVPGAPKVAPAVRVPMVQGQPPALIPQSTSFQEQLQGLLSFSQQAAQGQQVLQGLGGGSLRGGVPPQLLPYLPAPAAAAAAAAAVNAAAAAVAAPPDETYCCGVRQVAQPNVHALERLYASGPVSGLPKPPKSGQVATGGGGEKKQAKQRQQGRRSKPVCLKRGEKSNLTLDQLSACFHMPSDQACKQLGIGLTVLKRLCRKYDIKRWPFRKMKSLDRLIKNVKSGNLASKVKTSISELEATKRMLQENKIQDLDVQTRKLQQAFSKHDHKVRQNNRARTAGHQAEALEGPGPSKDCAAEGGVPVPALAGPSGGDRAAPPEIGQKAGEPWAAKKEAPQRAASGGAEVAASSGGGFFPNQDDNEKSPLTSERRAMLWIERLLQRNQGAVEKTITDLWEIAERKKDVHLFHILSSDPRLQELKGRVEEAPKPQDASLRVLPPEVTLAAAIADFMTS